MPSHLPKDINKLVGKAMHDYTMLSEGDRLLIGVSGGVDSLVVSWLLDIWRRKAPIHYEIQTVHLDLGFEKNAHQAVEEQLKHLNLPFTIAKTSYGIDSYTSAPDNACFNCARLRRNHLFDMAKDQGYSAIVLGHHKDDIIETFFLNMLYGGNISTMLPKQMLFNNSLKIIRPMSYLTKAQVYNLATIANIVPVKNPCPMSEKSKREEIRSLLDSLYKQNPSFRNTIFSSLSNVRTDYLLKQQ
nr:tRNA 2-thiocytidine biosynthesis protein TtcA [Desulfobulbaceae bacterium]